MTCYQHLREDQFERIASALPEYAGNVGRPVQDNRCFVEAVIWIGRNGGRWRCLPEVYGKRSSVHKRLKRWSEAGILQMIFNTFVEDAGVKRVMLDSTLVRAHQDAAGAKKDKNTSIRTISRRAFY
jgi:transposase